MTEDDHKPEGRTAHECFELSRIALDQAETVVNSASTTLECARAQAAATIAIGWARLGDALANEPRELDPIVMRAGQVMTPTDANPELVRQLRIALAEVGRAVGTHRMGIGDGCAACGMTREQAEEAAAANGHTCTGWGDTSAVQAVLYETPDHVHSPDCAHQWISPTEPCRACGQGTIRHQERCPVPCPEPGEWWVHLPGKPKDRG